MSASGHAPNGDTVDDLFRADELGPIETDTAAFSPDGARVVTVGELGSARVWDAKTSRLGAGKPRRAGSVSDRRVGASEYLGGARA